MSHCTMVLLPDPEGAEKITNPVILLFVCSIVDYCFFTSDSCPKR